jgi:hypothetical protein
LTEPVGAQKLTNRFNTQRLTNGVAHDIIGV